MLQDGKINKIQARNFLILTKTNNMASEKRPP